ncbi:MAG: hypothetical protein JW940_01985 [Polyangiaceae bacterium]|nr:hypothetical protein [Polyangiaceae bacterium]
MSAEAQARYRILLSTLLFEREAAGGDLPESDEAKFVGLLDEVWWQLTGAEQDEVERELEHEKALTAPETLGIVDCTVSEGTSALPRQAA